MCPDDDNDGRENQKLETGQDDSQPIFRQSVDQPPDHRPEKGARASEKDNHDALHGVVDHEHVAGVHVAKLETPGKGPDSGTE